VKRALLAFSISCSACAAKPQGPPPELVMTTTAQGDECRLTLDGQPFVTQRLESAQLTERLKQLRGKVVLQIATDAPYRCVGSAIITLQRANVTFRAPQLPSQ
jgi:hypothetical protein